MKKWSGKFVCAIIFTFLFSTISVSADTSSSGKRADETILRKVNDGYGAKKMSGMTLDGQERPWLSKDTIIIHYKEPLSQADYTKAGTTLVRNVPSLNHAIVRIPNKKDMNKALSIFRKNSKVVSSQPSAVYTINSFPSDPKKDRQYHLKTLDLEKAQQLAGNKEVTVAVIDQGIDKEHPEFKGRLLTGYNVKIPMNQPLPDFHGTHVAGIIAANKNNGLGGYGVNPNAKILPIDVFNREGAVSDYILTEAILYAVEKGAKVINMSLGSQANSSIIAEAVEEALSKKVTIVAAAGNEKSETPHYPAAYPGVISVGAVDKNNELAPFSSYGASVDLTAPGAEIYAPIYDPERKSTFSRLNGTSMAAPMVTGVVSLLLSKYPELTPYEVGYILNMSAKDLGPKGYDIRFGHGLINPIGALKFDHRKIPKPNPSPGDKLNNAQLVDIGDKFIKEGRMVKPNQLDLFKFKVSEGEVIQTVLSGSDQFDYQYTLHYFSDKLNQSLDINRVKQGADEGNLFKVPDEGFIVVEVKDKNGQYGHSEDNPSTYKLTVQKSLKLSTDESSFENMLTVPSLPYSENFTFTGDNGDEDFLKLKSKKSQLIRISTTAVAGLNPTIKVYSDEFLNDKNNTKPLIIGNSQGISKAENLIFFAKADAEYIINITNRKNEEDEWIPNYNSSIVEEASLLPYNVTIDAKDAAPDEDGIVSTVEVDKFSKSLFNIDHDIIPTVIENALEYSSGLTVTGSFHGEKDTDWFHFKPTVTGIYEFAIASADNNNSVAQLDINSIVEDENEEGKIQRWTDYPLATNRKLTGEVWEDDSYSSKIYAGLKSGTDYYIKLSNPNNRLSFSPYQVKSNLFMQNPQDRFEPNDTFEEAPLIPEGTLIGNFAAAGDRDIFYYRAKKDGLQGVAIEREDSSNDEQLKSLPASLLAPNWGYVWVYEDVNNNHRLDDKEAETVKYLDNGLLSGRSSGSFRAKKGKGYFLVAGNAVNQTSMEKYRLTFLTMNDADEDGSNTIESNVPSKPLAMKKSGTNKYSATGYFNSGIPSGDEDWYVVSFENNQKGRISLTAKNEVDGVITIFQNGKQIAKSNFYEGGDEEVLPFNLKKGTYHIKVNELFGHSSIEPYSLEIGMEGESK